MKLGATQLSHVFFSPECCLYVLRGLPEINRAHKAKATKARDSYIACLTEKPTSRLLQSSKWQLIGKSQWCCSAKCGRPLHMLTNNWTRGKQPANTPPPQSITPGLYPVSIHQMAPQERTSVCRSQLIYCPRKDERLSWPSWLTCIGRFTHELVTRAGRAQDRESSPTFYHCAPPPACISG